MTTVEQKISAMREGGHILADILLALSKAAKAGISTQYLENLAVEILKKNHAKSAFFGFNGYPKKICISINDEVVHGLPNKNRFIQQGDLVKIDMGVKYKGFNTDAAITISIGEILPKEKKLIEAAEVAFNRVATQIKIGDRIGKIGRLISETANEYGLSVIENLTGHGIGEKLHQDPIVYNFGNDNFGQKIKNGDTVAIEPMFAIGKPEIVILPDGWTVVTKDGSKSSHYEHTVFFDESGCKILTK